MLQLVKKGYKVYAIAPKGEYSEQFKDHGIIPIAYTIKRRSLNPFDEIKAIISIYKVIAPLRLNILSTFMLKPNIYGALAIAFLRLKNAKPILICAVTGLGSFYIEKSFKATMIKHLTQWLYRLSFLLSSKVIFQNSDDRSLFIAQKIIKAEKSVLIRSSGVDTNFFTPQDKSDIEVQELYKKLSIAPQSVVILMISRLIIHKGVGEYIAAAKRLKHRYKEVKCLLVGSFDEGNAFGIDSALLQDACDNEEILWLGERSDIKALIALSDIVVLPSYREGVPKTLLEAGAMGKPLVTCDSVGCKEVVQEGYNGFLAPIQDVDRLTDCISKLIEDGALREQFGKNSRRYVQENFSIEKVSSAYIELYQNYI